MDVKTLFIIMLMLITMVNGYNASVEPNITSAQSDIQDSLNLAIKDVNANSMIGWVLLLFAFLFALIPLYILIKILFHNT